MISRVLRVSFQTGRRPGQGHPAALACGSTLCKSSALHMSHTVFCNSPGCSDVLAGGYMTVYHKRYTGGVGTEHFY